MIKFIKKKLLSFLYFLEVYLKLRIRNKTSPIDIYYENLSLDCYKFFEKDMKYSSIFFVLKPSKFIIFFNPLAVFLSPKPIFILFLLMLQSKLTPKSSTGPLRSLLTISVKFVFFNPLLEVSKDIDSKILVLPEPFFPHI